jgi:hypothetical protein
MRRSRTNRPHTVYSYASIRNILSLPRKKRKFKDVCAMELDRLHASNFTNERIAEEIDYERREDKRLGRKVTKRVERLRDRAKKVLE